jgi:hypothetical protein
MVASGNVILNGQSARLALRLFVKSTRHLV